jgi:hypothetical protein
MHLWNSMLSFVPAEDNQTIRRRFFWIKPVKQASPKSVLIGVDKPAKLFRKNILKVCDASSKEPHMPRRRVYAAAFLALVLICLQVGPARPGILEKASQLINLVRTDPNPISLSSFLRCLPNGEAVAYTLPAGSVFMLTKMSWGFTATNTPEGAVPPDGDILFTVGNYYRAKAKLVNGRAGAVDGTTFGVPISNMSQAVKVSRFDQPGQVLPGTISIRLIGYTAPDN